MAFGGFSKERGYHEEPPLLRYNYMIGMRLKDGKES
jgi:hypothetical protein